MNRATGAAAARATDRLLHSQKCNCHQALGAEKRILVGRTYVVEAIVKLAEIASSPSSSTAEALLDCRKALSALDCEDES